MESQQKIFLEPTYLDVIMTEKVNELNNISKLQNQLSDRKNEFQKPCKDQIVSDKA